MSYKIQLQVACQDPLPIHGKTIKSWVQLTLEQHSRRCELTLRFVDTDEMIHLNSTYRQQHKPTNVLAFPSHLPDNVILNYPFLGDVIICPAVLSEEAQAQHKPLTDHWAHIVIHGVLHLLGFDHLEDADAVVMQAEEKRLLNKLDIPNPYQDEDTELD